MCMSVFPSFFIIFFFEMNDMYNAYINMIVSHIVILIKIADINEYE